MFSKKVERVKKIQDRLAKLQRLIRSEVDKMDKEVTLYIQQRWDETFPGREVHFLTGFIGGCLTNKWDAKVFFYSVDNAEILEGDWYRRENWDDELKIVEPSIPTNKLKRFLKELSKETGVKCILVDRPSLKTTKYDLNED